MDRTLRFFMLPACPHCKNAIRWMEELRSENPNYAQVPVVTVNEREQPDVANQFMYALVPTYYLDKTKLHEGVASKEKIRAVFDAYLAEETKA